MSIPPDLATCDACVEDIFTPSNPGATATSSPTAPTAGRFTIATDAPYDRAANDHGAIHDVRAVPARCEDVEDRRFHAQPVACPDAGPAPSVVRSTADCGRRVAERVVEGC